MFPRPLASVSLLIAVFSILLTTSLGVEATRVATNETNIISFWKDGDWGPSADPESLYQACIWAGFVAEVLPDNGLADLVTGRFRHESRKYLMIEGGLITASLVARVDMMMKIIMMKLALVPIPPPASVWNGTVIGTPAPPEAVRLTPNYLFFITQAPIVFFLLKAGGALQLNDYQNGVVISATAIYSNVGALLILALGQLLIKLIVSALTGRRASTNNLTSPFLHTLSIFIVPTAMHSAFYFTQEDLIFGEKPTLHNAFVGLLVGLFVIVFLGSLVSNGIRAPGDSWRQVMSWWYSELCPTPAQRLHYVWVTCGFLLSAISGMIGGNWIGAIFDGMPPRSQNLYTFGFLGVNLLSVLNNGIAVAFLKRTRKLSIPALLSDLILCVACFPQIPGNTVGIILAATLFLWGFRAIIVHLIQPIVDNRTEVPAPRAFERALLEYAQTLGLDEDVESGVARHSNEFAGNSSVPVGTLDAMHALQQQILAERAGSNCPRASDATSGSGAFTNEDVSVRGSLPTATGRGGTPRFRSPGQTAESQIPYDPFADDPPLITSNSSESQFGSGNLANSTSIEIPVPAATAVRTNSFSNPPVHRQSPNGGQTGIGSQGSMGGSTTSTNRPEAVELQMLPMPKLPSLMQLQLPPPVNLSASSSPVQRAPSFSNAPPVEPNTPLGGRDVSPPPALQELPPAWIRHLPDPNEALTAHQRRSGILRGSGSGTTDANGNFSTPIPLLSPRSNASAGSPCESPRLSANNSFALQANLSSNRSFSGPTTPGRKVSFRQEDVADPSKYGSPKRRLSRVSSSTSGSGSTSGAEGGPPRYVSLTQPPSRTRLDDL